MSDPVNFNNASSNDTATVEPEENHETVKNLKPVDKVKQTLGRVIRYTTETQSSKNISELKRGLNPVTEHYAYSQIIPLVDNKYDETKYLRLAGLIAWNHNLVYNQDTALPFGQWCQRYGESVHSNIETRLTHIINLPYEKAVEEINRIITITNTKFAPDWFSLGLILHYWSNKKNRQQLLVEFYRSYKKVEEKTPAESE